MNRPRRPSLSKVTLLVAALVVSLLLVLNLWVPYATSSAGSVSYGWPMPTHISRGLQATAPTQWNIPHLVADLFITALLTTAVAFIVEYAMCGGKLPHFSLLSTVFAILIAGLIMHVNFLGSTTASTYGWPFTCGAWEESDLYGMALFGNIVVGLGFTFFGGLLCEYALSALEDMRDYHRVHSGEVSWNTFAQDLHEKRKQEREAKTQGTEPGPPSDEKPDEQKSGE